MRAATYIPLFGSIVEPLIGSFKGFGELGRSIGENIRKFKRGGKEIRIDLRRKDNLAVFF